MKNRKLTLTAALIVLAAVVLTGGYMASNMGFKLNLSLLGGAGSNSGTNYVALPYNQQVGLVTARDWFIDIGGNVTNLSTHRKIDDLFDFYGVNGTSQPPNGFNITPGTGYIVNVSASQNYVVVGSHDPSLQINLLSTGTASGTNYYAHPYHGTAANARDLFEEIGTGTSNISLHREVDDLFDFYGVNGTSLPPNGFSIDPGTAYIVNVSQDITFTPAHF